MPIFKRTPKPAPPIPAELPAGEECDRSLRATLLQGKASLKGALYLTNRRLMFYADRGDARWLIVPFAEMKATGVYPAPRAAMGAPGMAARALFIETTSGEHVWYSFDQKTQDEWLAAIRERVAAVPAAEENDA